MAKARVTKVASLRRLSAGELRKRFRMIGGADIVTAAALGALFREHSAGPSTVVESSGPTREDVASDRQHERQVMLSGVPGIGIEAHAREVATLARGAACVRGCFDRGVAPE